LEACGGVWSVVALEACRRFGAFEAGQTAVLNRVADRVVALERRVPLLATRESSSTPPVVPGAAPALAKAGVGGYFMYVSFCDIYIYIYIYLININTH